MQQQTAMKKPKCLISTSFLSLPWMKMLFNVPIEARGNTCRS